MESNDSYSRRLTGLPGGFAGITEYWDLTKPVICAVNGIAVGGGFEIALACDIILCIEESEFFFPEMQRGFLPDVGGIQQLPRKLPYNVTMELLYTGRKMPTAEAKHWGLVSEILSRAALLTRAQQLAKRDAEKEQVPGCLHARGNLPLISRTEHHSLYRH